MPACPKRDKFQRAIRMTAVDEAFWAGFNKQIADAVLRENTVSCGTEKPMRPHLVSAPALVRDRSEPEAVRMPVAAPEWSGVLNIINEARLHAEAQKDQLQEQAAAFDQVIQEMREEAAAVRQQMRMLEAKMQETKAEAERQSAEIRAQAEGQMRQLQAKVYVEITEARSATRTAEERAYSAEDWLKRIEEAAKSLALSIGTSAIRRAA